MADCLEGIPEEIRDYIQQAEDPRIVLEQLRNQNKRKRELVEMSANAQVRISGLISQHPEGPVAGIRSILKNDAYAIANNSNIEYRQKALQGYAEKFMPTLKSKLSTTKLGFDRNKELGRDFVRAVFEDPSSSKEAKELAQEWYNTSDFIRERFNEYGGDVGDLGRGYLPQGHDRTAIGKSGREEWISFTRDRLDIGRMKIDFDQFKARILTDIKKDLGFTGRKKKFTKTEQAKIESIYAKRTLNAEEDAITEFLSNAYDTLATGGLNKIKEGAASMGKGKSIANKNADERVLHFDGADNWISYQEKFGNADPMAAIDNHVRGMTTDMSMVEILGPNPMHMFETMKVQVMKMKEASGDTKGFDSRTDAIFQVVSGKVDQDLDGIGMWATAAQVGRGINVATMLGSASLSAVTDLGGLFVTARRNKIGVSRVMKNFIGNLNVKNQDDAIRAGLGADVFNSEVSKRFSEMGQGWWAKASEALMRATFMNIWTEAARKSFQTEMMHKLLNGRKIGDLSVNEHIRMLEQVQEETAYAVLTPGAGTRAITTAGKAKGTAVGEVVRSTTQFQSFTLTFMEMHGSRMFLQGSAGSKIAYGATLFTVMTLLGGSAVMMKDLAKGYTPRRGSPLSEDQDPEDIAKFWVESAAQGGGAGIFGDLIFHDQTRFGSSAVPTILGPSASIIDDGLVKLGIGNTQKAIAGDDTHVTSEAIDFMNRHANPTNTFYTKALMEKYVFRNLKLLLDEDYEKAERRKQRKRRKEYGQEQFEWLQD